MSLDALLIDEFQDLDAAQSMLIEILALGHGNLFVVGDDDQMIYGWRGADIERLRRFFKDPYTRNFRLSTNYRSSQLVVRHAGYLISHNHNEKRDRNVRSREGACRGKVELFIGEDIGQELNFLVKALDSAKEEGFQWKDVAVLVRYREYYKKVFEALDRADIPFACKAKGTLYSRRAARVLADFFAAVLEWPFPPKDVWEHVLKVSDIYPRNEYLAEVSQATDPISFLRSGSNTKDAAQKKSITKLLSNLRTLSEKQKSENLNTYDLFQAIDTTFRLANHFKQELGVSEDNDVADEGSVIELLLQESKDFPDPYEFLNYCRTERDREVEESNSAGKESVQEQDTRDAVQVMTIHKAKGKEWRGVVLFHQEWRKGSSDESEEKKLVEEERRVVYVGATRAIETLWVTAERGKKSRFVNELFKDPKFSDLDVSQEAGYRQERLKKIEQETNRLKAERNQAQIAVDRAQGIDQDCVQKELNVRKQSMGFLRQLLFSLGLKPSRLRRLKKDLQVAERSAQAIQQIEEINHQISVKKDKAQDILEEMDRLRREVMFRRILSDPIKEGNSSQAAPF